MKICILGNSHAAALKHGWDRINSEYPDVDADIFSMRGQNMAELELVGHSLSLAQTSKNKMYSFPQTAGNVIDLKSYDGFILHGLGLRVSIIPGAVFSKACRETAVVDAVKATALWGILSDIRKVSDVKILVGHTPLRTALSVQSNGPSAEYRLYLDEMNEHCFRDLTAAVVAQPDNTIVNGCMTDPKYNTDVVSLTKEALEESGARHSDLTHMNPAFGVEMLREFLGEFSRP
ncbi:MAG: hypothetical protein COC12_00545 [Rhodobacteraceae bacterium]|nr:MAG: hypothetical protein COC12_00545 [Paracoccaceae bacterium]